MAHLETNTRNWAPNAWVRGTFQGRLGAMQPGMVPKATSELSCADTAAAPLGTDLAAATAAPGAWGSWVRLRPLSWLLIQRPERERPIGDPRHACTPVVREARKTFAILPDSYMNIPHASPPLSSQ